MHANLILEQMQHTESKFSVAPMQSVCCTRRAVVRTLLSIAIEPSKRMMATVWVVRVLPLLAKANVLTVIDSDRTRVLSASCVVLYMYIASETKSSKRENFRLVCIFL